MGREMETMLPIFFTTASETVVPPMEIDWMPQVDSACGAPIVQVFKATVQPTFDVLENET